MDFKALTQMSAIIKKISLCFLLLSCSAAQAQISDPDAKLKYQQAVDAFNEADYVNAVKITDDLKEKMGEWNPKTLYLNLKSGYRNFTEINQKTSARVRAELESFNIFYNRCDILFSMINKDTYPQDKYNEILEIQQYFKQQQEKYAVQKDRTPQDAIDFIVKISRQYPNKGLGGTEGDIVKKIVDIQIRDTHLQIRTESTIVGDNFKPYIEDFDIDLSKSRWEDDNRFSLFSDDQKCIKSFQDGSWKSVGKFMVRSYFEDPSIDKNPSPRFASEKYWVRVQNAFDFLVTQAGGGKKTEGTIEKF